MDITSQTGKFLKLSMLSINTSLESYIYFIFKEKTGSQEGEFLIKRIIMLQNNIQILTSGNEHLT